MNEYPRDYDLPITFHRLIIWDGHPITGNREYERVYFTSFEFEKRNPAERFIVIQRMKEKGWQLCRTIRYEYGGVQYTFVRKKLPSNT